MAGQSKNDKAWQQLFDELSIREHIDASGHYVIDAETINQVREARLMAKFDHKSNIPEVFKSKSTDSINILPISRGKYVLSRINTFQSVDTSDIPIEPVDIPTHIETIDFQQITSEPAAISAAFHAGILNRFIGKRELFHTISGRMGSGDFSFVVDRAGPAEGPLNVTVQKAQVEIDAGFETDDALFLVEAKNSPVSDFNIRQLYYPYRLWANSIGKTVRNIFLSYSNGVYDIAEYIFTESHNFSSIQPLNRARYKWNLDNASQPTNIEQLVIGPEEKPDKVPFPQADDFNKVIGIFEQIGIQDGITKDEITAHLDYDPRQSDYYVNACIYLGWVVRIGERPSRFALSNIGQQIFDLPLSSRNMAYSQSILSDPIFADVYQEKQAAGDLSKDRIVAIMKRHGIPNVDSDSTYWRRANTVNAWTNWALKERLY